MADGGELAAAFRALAEDAGQAGENIGNSMGRWFEDTAGIEEENVNRTLAADAQNADALNAIRPDPGNLLDGGAGDTEGSSTNNIARLLNGEDAGVDDQQLSDQPTADDIAGGQLKWTRNHTINRSVDRTLKRVNPKFNPKESAYSENCTGVVQANELTRRGIPSEAGPLEESLRSDQNGPGGCPFTGSRIDAGVGGGLIF
jgi:hypothetical protein